MSINRIHDWSGTRSGHGPVTPVRTTYQRTTYQSQHAAPSGPVKPADFWFGWP